MMRWAVGALSLGIGASTAIVPPASTAAMIVAVLGIVAAFVITRFLSATSTGGLRPQTGGNDV